MNAAVGKYRWTIVALLFFATTLNYIDRQVLSITSIDEAFQKEMLGKKTNDILTDNDKQAFKKLLGNVDTAFKIAYGIGFLLVGWLIDKLGTRKGFSLAMLVWCIAGICHGLVNNVRGLMAARFGLGIGEAGNFPAGIKTIAEWFPKKERAFAAGVMNAGANLGVIITAVAVPILIMNFGWRASFVITGAFGFLVLLFWLLFYNKPENAKKLSHEELIYILSDKEDTNQTRIAWIKLFPLKQTWAFALAKFFTDCVWYFFLTWLPLFFAQNNRLDERLDLKTVGPAFFVIYIISDIGSIFFGWLSSNFIKQGWSVNRARKTTLLLCGICVLPIFFAALTHSIYVAIGLIAIATAAHQGFSTNIYTIVSDVFPKNAVASVLGIGGTVGTISGVLMTQIVGNTTSYLPVFIYASTAYLIATLVIHLLIPKLNRVII